MGQLSGGSGTHVRNMGRVAWDSAWRRAAACGVAVAMAAAVVAVPLTFDSPARADARLIAEAMTSGDSARLAQSLLPERVFRMTPDKAALAVANDPVLAGERAVALPSPASTDPTESGLAQFKSILDTGVDADEVAAAYRGLSTEATQWLAVTFPRVIGNLTGASFTDRIAANRIRAAAAVEESRTWPSPKRPWTKEPRAPRRDFAHLIDPDRQFVYFDQMANRRKGSWIEVRGNLDTATHLGVLVPGGSAFLANNNFGRYSARADSFVEAAGGELAMIVWAAAESPSGWIEEADPAWAQEAAPKLVAFLDDLNRQLTGRNVSVTVAGHSYGGAVVGLAETRGFAADRVMHVASAGSGFGVEGLWDYARPCRQRYSMMAPGDPIDYVQNVPASSGLGHGPPAADLPGTFRLSTGYLPDDPRAEDDVGRSLGSQGLTGKRISGIHAHSEVFIPDSDAWRNMLAVFSMEDPRSAAEQPPPNPAC